MKQNADQEKQTTLARKGGMSGFLKALIWTAIPFLILTIVQVIVTQLSQNGGASSSLVVINLGGIVFFLVAIVASVVFGIRGKLRITAGVFTGLAIGIIVLGASCFAIPGLLG
jgi:hypothetical protein